MLLPRLATLSGPLRKSVRKSQLDLLSKGVRRTYAALLDPAHSVDFELPRLPQDEAKHASDMLKGGFEYHWHVNPGDQQPPVTPVRRNSPNGSTPFVPLNADEQAQYEPENREIPHDATGPGRSPLDARLIHAARAVYQHIASRQLPDLKQLLNHFDLRAGVQLDFELPMEPTPPEERKTPLTSPLTPIQELRAAWDDGSLLVVYVSGGLVDPSSQADADMRISVCSGFCVPGGEQVPAAPNVTPGPLMVTCAHTLQNAFRVPLAPKGTPAAQGGFMPHSVAFAISRQGAIYPIKQLVSSLPLSDLVLYQLDSDPILLDGAKPSGSLRTLPVSPYPAVVGTEVAVASFIGWGGDSGAALPAWASGDEVSSNLEEEDGTKKDTDAWRKVLQRRRNLAGRSRWGRAEVTKYRDECGAEAHTGTYDSLSQMEFMILPRNPHNPPMFQSKDAPGPPSDPGSMPDKPRKRFQHLPDFPPPGSSGGPVVDVSTGAVVGIVRSTKYGFLAGRHGDAVPAEHLFNWFALPGLGKKG